MELKVYLAGEIHTDWRAQMVYFAEQNNLPLIFRSPVTDHELSDDVGTRLLGSEEKRFWQDHKGALINTARIRLGIGHADLVVIKFGDDYKQWNAAFDAGVAHALGKPYLVIQPESHDHALKELNAHATAVVRTEKQAVDVLEYLTMNK